jgi:hypothetical protein
MYPGETGDVYSQVLTLKELCEVCIAKSVDTRNAVALLANAEALDSKGIYGYMDIYIYIYVYMYVYIIMYTYILFIFININIHIFTSIYTYKYRISIILQSVYSK